MSSEFNEDGIVAAIEGVGSALCSIAEPEVYVDCPAANMVEGLVEVSLAATRIANAITPTSVSAGTDAQGGHVESLTEAVMGLTAAMSSVALAIGSVAEAIASKK